jgi:post-segregation antitoxin (ccd killing protein)
MRMARVNVYIPDDLAEAARDAGLNVSRIAQDALRDALAAGSTDRWLASLPREPTSAITHEDVMDALNAARDEFGTVAD